MHKQISHLHAHTYTHVHTHTRTNWFERVQRFITRTLLWTLKHISPPASDSKSSSIQQLINLNITQIVDGLSSSGQQRLLMTCFNGFLQIMKHFRPPGARPEKQTDGGMLCPLTKPEHLERSRQHLCFFFFTLLSGHNGLIILSSAEEQALMSGDHGIIIVWSQEHQRLFPPVADNQRSALV